MSAEEAPKPNKKYTPGCLMGLALTIAVALAFEFLLHPWALWPYWPRSPLGDWNTSFTDPYGISHRMRLHIEFKPTTVGRTSGANYSLTGESLLCTSGKALEKGGLSGHGWGLGGSASLSTGAKMTGLVISAGLPYRCKIGADEMRCTVQFDDPTEEIFQRTQRRMLEVAQRAVERQERGEDSYLGTAKDAWDVMGSRKNRPYKFPRSTIIFKREDKRIDTQC
jgi:hypothetical protein